MANAALLIPMNEHSLRCASGRPAVESVVAAAKGSGAFDAGIWLVWELDAVEGMAKRLGVHAATDETAALAVAGDVAVIARAQPDCPLLRPERFAAVVTAAGKAGAAVTAVRYAETVATGCLAAWKPGSEDAPPEHVIVPRIETLSVRENVPEGVFSLVFKARRAEAPAKPIRLFVIDADGVLTDAGFYYNESGEALKKFNTRDGAGLKQLMKLGVEVGIITGEATGFVPARAKKLGITRLELGCANKLPVLNAWREELGLEWDEVAYVGDDLPDLACVRAAGLGACPIDAEPEVRDAADYVATTRGGQGAVRDVIRWAIAHGRVG